MRDFKGMRCGCVKKEKECRKCGVFCENPNYEEIGWMIDNAEHYIVCACTRQIEYRENGYLYGVCDYDPKKEGKDIDCLLSYIKVLKKMWALLQKDGYEWCMCFENWNCIKDKVLKIIGICKEGVGSQMVEKLDNNWLVNNPGMTTFERWERSLYQVAPVLEFCVKQKEVKSMELIFEATVKKELKPEVLVSAFKSAADKEGFDINVIKKRQEIALEASARIKESNREVSFSTRKKAGIDRVSIENVSRKVAKEIVVSANKKINKKDIIIDVSKK